ncbi:acyl-CoA dehydrogenase family protein [Nocardia sp. alder85J]|uniref:acyl-CoA dehydrogenase family protein n=1 Tax=Nocardia sp. alder85J TaxID=2862949 RepID=UPI001CD36593|nr:acyl-CoA dehydrogenase family protein [Nocardia sp. alder85J]MCX4093677.1 acyl-CoA dehydrogenase family protein [Nocardia sp. alder85J]
MDFARVELSGADADFRDRARAFLDTHVTDEVRRRDRATGDNFDEAVHLAMGAGGWLAGELRPEAGGGFDRVRTRLWELEKRRYRVPWVTWSTTAIVVPAVRRHGSPELREEVLPGVYDGRIRLCLGYTEPDGGSDVATCRTRAVRDGDDWVINGAKMFTTGAHNCRYVFLITNTDPDGPRHRNLTMFLVPLSSPGIEIHGIHTVDGDRTNIVHYTDVRVPDRYRLGEVNGGWAVLQGPLNEEHGVRRTAPDGLQDISIMAHHGAYMATVVDDVAATVARPGPDGRRRLDDDAVACRLGRSVARMEAALSAPGVFGRVAIAQTMRDIAPELMDILGPAAALPTAAAAADDGGGPEYLFRWAPLCGIYGGTLEVFRNIIAQQILGLGRPDYTPPR